MAIRIKNRTGHLVTVALNTRHTIHLAPQDVSRPLEDYESRDNPQIQKLLGRHEIETLDPETSAAVFPKLPQQPGR